MLKQLNWSVHILKYSNPEHFINSISCYLQRLFMIGQFVFFTGPCILRPWLTRYCVKGWLFSSDLVKWRKHELYQRGYMTMIFIYYFWQACMLFFTACFVVDFIRYQTIIMILKILVTPETEWTHLATWVDVSHATLACPSCQKPLNAIIWDQSLCFVGRARKSVRL